MMLCAPSLQITWYVSLTQESRFFGCLHGVHIFVSVMHLKYLHKDSSHIMGWNHEEISAGFLKLGSLDSKTFLTLFSRGGGGGHFGSSHMFSYSTSKQFAVGR